MHNKNVNQHETDRPAVGCVWADKAVLGREDKDVRMPLWTAGQQMVEKRSK